MMMNGFSRISGIGAYIPQQVVSSADLMVEANCHKFGISEQFLTRSCGIKERRFSDDRETFGYMAAMASRTAIVDAGIDPMDIDMVLFCGIDRDQPEPATAHEIQQAIEALNAECLDISNACIGSNHGLAVANAYIAAGAAENILVCTGEKPSYVTKAVLNILKTTNEKAVFRKYMGAFTVGDAGGAFVVSKSTGTRGFKSIHFKSYGKHSELCFYRFASGVLEFDMQMESISNLMIETHADLINDTYEKAGWNPESIGKVYCDQVDAKPHKKMAIMARQSLDKLPNTYEYFGNLTSATFAVNMYLNPTSVGDKVLFMGAGSGITLCQMGMEF